MAEVSEKQKAEAVYQAMKLIIGFNSFQLKERRRFVDLLLQIRHQQGKKDDGEGRKRETSRTESIKKDGGLPEERPQRQEKVNGLVINEVESVRCLTSGIEDGISDAACELLYRLARDVPEGQAIVEIGRGKGKSTVWLVRGSEVGKKNKVFSFASQKESPDSVNADFTTNVAVAEIQDTLVSRHETAEGAAYRWKESIGLLWINTSHEYENVKRVILSWQRHLSSNARVAIRGYDQPGIARVIRESVGILGNLTYKQSVDTTMVLTIDQCTHYWIIDSDEIGACKYCGRKRDFKRLMRETAETQIKKRQTSKK